MPIERLKAGSFMDEERLAALQDLVPEAFKDGAINWAVLKDSLAGLLEDEGPEAEHFGLDWPGKREARRLASRPSSGALIPCPGEGVDEERTRNIYIEGENLEVLKLLRKAYAGRVKMIYIDPPYNTGNDFVYDDDFTEPLQDYLKRTGQVDGEGRPLTTNKKSDGRFHSKWLSMMYPRLRLARDLLRDDGVIFVSIDDNEVHHLRMLMNEVFGEENFIADLVWKSKSGGANDSRYLAIDHEYIISFGKNANKLFFLNDKEAEVTTNYNQKDENGEYALDRLDKQSLGYIESLDYPIIGPDGKEYRVEHKNPRQKVARWRWSRDTVKERYSELVFKDGYVYTKNYKKEGVKPRSLLIEERFGRTRTGKTELASIMDIQVFDNPKPPTLLGFLARITLSEKDIILDFFSGSATTAHAVLDLNKEDGGKRQFILVQMPEATPPDSEAAKAGYKTIAEIGKERIRRVIKKVVSEQWAVVSEEEKRRYGCREVSNGQLKEGSKKLTTDHSPLTTKEVNDDGNQVLPGPDCVAKGDGSGGADLFNSEEVAQGRSIRSVRSDAKIGGVDSVEHRGGTSAKFDEGVSTVSVHRKGIKGGTGNAAAPLRESGIPCRYGYLGSDAALTGDREDGHCSFKGTPRCPLTTAHLPLTTDHSPLDLGFKVFKLAPSSFKPWEEYRGDDLARLEELFAEAVTPLVPGWRTIKDGLFTEILLLEGYPLDSRVRERGEFTMNLIREVASDFHEKRLLICLDEQLDEETVKALNLTDKEIFICLDSAVGDQLKARLSDKGLIKTI